MGTYEKSKTTKKMNGQEAQEREDRFVTIRFEVLGVKELSPSEKLVYARICAFKKYFESKEECSINLGISKDTVVKAKQKLAKLGFIKEIGNTGRGKIYQSVYDDNERVVKSTNQSGKKPPIRVVKSTNIEEIEKKERRKNIVSKDTIGETPKKMTNLDIDHLMEYWEITVGYAIQGKKQANRYACNNLIKKLTVTGVEQVINGVALAHGDKYAPKISDFCSLQAKLNDLILWGKNYGNNKSFIKI